MRQDRVVAAGGAEAFLRYKLNILQYLADHPPRVSLPRLGLEVRPPADLPAVFRNMVSLRPAPCTCPVAVLLGAHGQGLQPQGRWLRAARNPCRPGGASTRQPVTTGIPHPFACPARPQDVRTFHRRFLNLEVWVLSGPDVYSSPGLVTAELCPFPLPRDAGPEAPRFPPACPAFKGTAASCPQQERCQWGHARVRLFK